MKDAFGGSYMIYVFIGFTIIFILFISLILKYGQAFKIKNTIIEYIEEYESYQMARDKIDNYIENDSLYRIDMDSSMAVNLPNSNCTNLGYCVVHHSKNGDAEGYYSVYTFVKWEFPFFRLHNTWIIKGETRPVSG